jgi:hypothetical protein
MVTTWRLITPVMAIRPTFWLNEVLGSAPKTPGDRRAEAVGEGRARISLSVASRPAPPLVMPETSPTVSIAETMAIRQKPMMRRR